jgi:hypothetical protein
MPELSFTRHPEQDLYAAADEATPAELRPRYLLRQPRPEAPDTLTLRATWSEAAYDGYYLFLSAPLPPDQERSLAQVLRNQGLPGGTRLLWVDNPRGVPPRVIARAVAREGALLQDAAFTLRNLSLQAQAGCTIAPADSLDAFELKPAGEGRILFRAAPGAEPVLAPAALRVPLTGAGAGAPAFACALDRAALAVLGGDVRYFHRPAGDPRGMVERRHPVFLLDEGTTVGFDASLDPLRPADPARTRFAFDAAARASELDGCFSTPTGRRLRLRPREDAALALCSTPAGGGRERGWYLAPSGGFDLVDPAGAAVPSLMCGLVPTEYVAPTGSALAFLPGKPAFAPGFPPAAEHDAVTELLDSLEGTATTAWLRPVDAELPSGYFAQPPRAVYFGHPSAVAPKLVEVVPVRVGEYGAAMLRSADYGLPAAPYAGIPSAFDGADTLPAFERDVLAAARWRIAPFLADGPRFGAGAAPAPRTAGEPPRALRRADAAGRGTALSPQGFLAVLNEDGSWRELVLARGPGGTARIAFVPAPGGRAIARQLAFALLSSDVFLVVSRGGESTLGGFESSVALGGFTLDLAPAAAGAELESILLFKFRRGALRELVDDVNAWTSPDPFNDKVGDTFPVQQTIRQFLLAAERSEDPNLREFHRRVAVDPAWRGVLALNARVSGLRPELDGLRGRMDRPLRGHHLGIEVNQVQAEPADIVTSSLFGLILYPPVAEPPPGTPRHRVPALRLHPPPPAASKTAAGEEEPPDQDFAVEELTVLFRNSEVAEFRCRVALVLERLFGREVERVGPGGNRVLLTGSFQSREGVGGFTLQAPEAARFRLPAPEGMVRVLETVALAGAEFATAASVPQPDGKAKVTARFALAGGLGFAAAALPLDLFGYGGDDAGALLPFTGLSLDYDFLRAPDGTVSEAGPLRFNAAAVAFGTPPEGSLRAGSLAAGMPLQLRGFRWAADGLSAPGVGAQAVQVPLLTAEPDPDGGPSPAGHLTASPRYALEFRLPLGSLGSLSTVQVSLDAGLLLGWGPSDTVPQDDAAAVWVRLPALTPGIAGYSLQGVLKTSFGEGNLFRFQRASGRDVYSLLFNNVALKLFGFTLPPGVVLDFVLFADPGPAPGTSNLGWYLGYVPKEDA